MYTFDKQILDTIEMIQEGKKQFVKTMIKDQEVAEAMNTFVDSQTDYTKKAYQTTMDASSKLGLAMYDWMNKMGKFDTPHYISDMFKSFTELNKKYQGSK